MQELISVIIPARNASKYLKEAILSVKAQKLNTEIIVIDDGRVAESGDYQALMDKKALFYDMYTKQIGWYEEAYA